MVGGGFGVGRVSSSSCLRNEVEKYRGLRAALAVALAAARRARPTRATKLDMGDGEGRVEDESEQRLPTIIPVTSPRDRSTSQIPPFTFNRILGTAPA